MSKKRRWRPVSGSRSKNRARRSGSAQYGFASSVAMWLGTMSSTIPSPAARAAAASERNAALAAQRRGEPRRVDHVVAVRSTWPCAS